MDLVYMGTDYYRGALCPFAVSEARFSGLSRQLQACPWCLAECRQVSVLLTWPVGATHPRTHAPTHTCTHASPLVTVFCSFFSPLGLARLTFCWTNERRYWKNHGYHFQNLLFWKPRPHTVGGLRGLQRGGTDFEYLRSSWVIMMLLISSCILGPGLIQGLIAEHLDLPRLLSIWLRIHSHPALWVLFTSE